MEQIFIKVQAMYGKRDIDILHSIFEQRESYYNSLSKGQIMHLLEKFIENKLVEENRK